MARRRAPGEGSIYFNKDRDRWEGLLDLGRGVNGKRVRRKVTGRTQQQVAQKLAELRDRVGGSWSLPNRALTLTEYLDEWLVTDARRTKESTQRIYRASARLHITPTLGNIRLDRMGPRDIQKMFSRMEQHGYSSGTIHHAFRVLKAALNDAIRAGLLSRNPCQAASPPRLQKRKKGRWLEPDELARFVRAAPQHPLGLPAIFTAACALRRCETLGLCWNDVDLEAKEPTIFIARQLQYVPRQGLHFFDPKTEKSERSLFLPEIAADILRLQRTLRPSPETDPPWEEAARYGGLVFPNPSGQPIRPDTFTKAVSSMAKSAGLPHLTPHDLRRSGGSLMLAGGADIKVIQEVMGHSSLQVTGDIYMKALPAGRLTAARAIAWDMPPSSPDGHPMATPAASLAATATKVNSEIPK